MMQAKMMKLAKTLVVMTLKMATTKTPNSLLL
jgi:hypothetical protein